MDRATKVIAELKRRAEQGHPLNSGANRGDWLYSAAVLVFGSWSRAVEAAGFAYQEIKSRPFTKREVIAKLKALADSGDPILAKDHEYKLGSAARRHFGSWKEATVAAGGLAGPFKWTPQLVTDAIRGDIEAGEPVNSVAMVRRNLNLYQAGRRRFGTWAAALEAATGRPDPVVAQIRAETARRLPMTEQAVRRRNLPLHSAAIARFGRWDAAVEAARGPVPADVRLKASAQSRRR